MEDYIENLTDRIIKETIHFGKIVGEDQYSEKPMEYPECYAKFLLSLYYKYKKSNNVYYLEVVPTYIKYMLNLKKETEEYVYWGLPYDWGNTLTTDGFLITTSFCLKPLYLWYKEGVLINKHIIRKSINWCMSLLHKDSESGFNYSNKLKQNIYNATSIAAGVLAICSEFLSFEELKEIEKIISSLINVQKNGYWNYSSNKVDVDLLHQCYTCEGILDYCGVFFDDKNLNSALAGVVFINKNKSFFKTERYLFSINDPEKIHLKFKHLLLRLYLKSKIDNNKRFIRTRAWSYAAYIRVLILSYNFTNKAEFKIKIYEVLKFIIDNLINKRKILFQKGFNVEYIRNSYHLLESLCLIEFYESSEEEK